MIVVLSSRLELQSGHASLRRQIDAASSEDDDLVVMSCSIKSAYCPLKRRPDSCIRSFILRGHSIRAPVDVGVLTQSCRKFSIEFCKVSRSSTDSWHCCSAFTALVGAGHDVGDSFGGQIDRQSLFVG